MKSHFVGAMHAAVLLVRNGIVWSPHYQMKPWVIFD